MKKDISQEELKPNRVIFNGDWDNYEEFANLEKAENFASRYTGAKIKPNFKPKENNIQKIKIWRNKNEKISN